MVVIKGSEATFDAFAFSLGRFCIAALAFAPFLAEGLADEALWAPAVELGLWMGAPVAKPYVLVVLLGVEGVSNVGKCFDRHIRLRRVNSERARGVQAWVISRRRR